MPPDFGQAVYVVTPLLLSGQRANDGPHFVMTPPVHVSQPGKPVKVSVTPCDPAEQTTSCLITFDGQTVQCLPCTVASSEESSYNHEGNKAHHFSESLSELGSGSSECNSWVRAKGGESITHKAGTRMSLSEAAELHTSRVSQLTESSPVESLTDFIKVEIPTTLSVAPSKENGITYESGITEIPTEPQLKQRSRRKPVVSRKIISVHLQKEGIDKDCAKKYKVIRKYGKRGRPRKNAIPIKILSKRILNPEEDEFSDYAQGPRKKRGRPRKSSVHLSLPTVGSDFVKEENELVIVKEVDEDVDSDKHAEPRKLTCKERKKRKRKPHRRRTTEELGVIDGRYPCPICTFSAKSDRGIEQHKRTKHAKELNLKDPCPVCGEEFFVRKHCVKHLREVHGMSENSLRTCLCTVCGKMYSTEAYREHARIHQDKSVRRKFPCTFEGCNYAAFQKELLKIHINSNHTGERNYLCQKCGKSFANKYCLTAHKHIHETEKPFVCEFEGCGERFRRRAHLNTHSLRHSDAKPMKCQLCDYACRQRPSMDCHMKSRHGMTKKTECLGTDGRKRTVYIPITESHSNATSSKTFSDSESHKSIPVSADNSSGTLDGCSESTVEHENLEIVKIQNENQGTGEASELQQKCLGRDPAKANSLPWYSQPQVPSDVYFPNYPCNLLQAQTSLTQNTASLSNVLHQNSTTQDFSGSFY